MAKSNTGGVADIVDLYKFGEFAVKSGYVREDRVKYWLNWVKRYSRLVIPPYIGNTGDRIRYFIDALKVEPGMEDWRLRQAEEAVRIYETLYLPSLVSGEEVVVAGAPGSGRTSSPLQEKACVPLLYGKSLEESMR